MKALLEKSLPQIRFYVLNVDAWLPGLFFVTASTFGSGKDKAMEFLRQR